MKRSTFRIITLFAVLALIADASCHKQPDPPPPPTIEGHWVNLTDTHPDWQYDFHDNILTQKVDDFGATIITQEYTYAVRHDTILIGGAGNNKARIWKAEFVCDSVAIIHNLTPGLLVAPTLYLRKLQ